MNARHIELLAELRAAGHLKEVPGKLVIVNTPFWPESAVRGSVRTAHWNESIDVQSGAHDTSSGWQYEMYLAENPIVTEDGEITFLHEMAHIILRHVGTSTKPYICEYEVGYFVAKLRPQWADKILVEMREQVKEMCIIRAEESEYGCGWARRICEEVGFMPDLTRDHWYD